MYFFVRVRLMSRNTSILPEKLSKLLITDSYNLQVGPLNYWELNHVRLLERVRGSEGIPNKNDEGDRCTF